MTASLCHDNRNDNALHRQLTCSTRLKHATELMQAARECMANLDQLVEVGVCDICETYECLPVLLPLLWGPLILQKGLKLLLYLPMQLLQIELSLPLPPHTFHATSYTADLCYIMMLYNVDSSLSKI